MENKKDTVYVIPFLLIIFILGAIVGGKLIKTQCEKSAIAAGAARYNPINRNFEFKKRGNTYGKSTNN